MIYPHCLNGPMMMADERSLRTFALACSNATGATHEQAIEARARRIEAAGDISLTERMVLTSGGFIQNGVAVLAFTGTIYRQATYINELYAYYFGDSIMEYLFAAFDAAIADSDIKGIIGRFDTIGGEAIGCYSGSEKIFQARGTKPLIAQVEGGNYSAGYYFSSAFDKIYSTPDSGHGSIGTCISFYNYDKMLKEMGIEEIEIVSSVSPDKRPDETTKEGRALYQERVDALGNQFVESVARNRGITVQTVLSDYGKGWIKGGQEALDSGMIDGFATFDEVLNSLAQGKEVTPRGTRKPQSLITKSLQGVTSMFGLGKHKVAMMQDGKQIGETEVEFVAVAANGAPASANDASDATAPALAAPVAAGSPPAVDAQNNGENQQLNALREKVAASFATTHCVKAVAGEQDAYKAKLTALHVKAQQGGFEDELEACFALATGKVEATANFGAALGGVQLEGAQAVQPEASAKGAEPTPERVAELLAQSPLGQKVIASLGK